MNCAHQLKETLVQIFPREADRQHWLQKPNELLCGNEPQRLVDQERTEQVLEALHLQLGNVIGTSTTGPSAGFVMWRQVELALQAHQGAPKKAPDPNCPLCSGKGIRHDDEDGDAFYCVCVYRETPVWTTP